MLRFNTLTTQNGWLHHPNQINLSSQCVLF